jgi:GTPase SAR1 family protein
MLQHEIDAGEMRDNYYRLGEGFLVVYSITMRETFNAVNRFYDHILQVRKKFFPLHNYFSQVCCCD